MNEGTAIELAKLKMREVGVGENYILRYRHLCLDPNEKIILKGEHHLYVIVHLDEVIKVSSKMGIYDQMDTGINENQHVHGGIIKIKNQGEKRSDVKFIQVIPLHKQPNK